MSWTVLRRARSLVVAGFAASLAFVLAPSARGQDEDKVMLNVGDKAPPFRLMGSDGAYHSLEQHKGKRPVVLAFFPKAFTGG